jgi:hypothetical protein
VDRLIYVSLSNVEGSVFEQMLRIRERALVRNVADKVCVALLSQSGWFIEWMEGPSSGIRAVMERVARDTRHRQITVVHSSRGPRRLTQPWSMALKQTGDKQSNFAPRVFALGEQYLDKVAIDPISVWRNLSFPVLGPTSTGQTERFGCQRVMICAAIGTQSFDIVQWLGQKYRWTVVNQRCAGERGADVAMSYVDLAVPVSAVVRRVVAVARNGLQIGVIQALLPEYSHFIVLLSGQTKSDAEMVGSLMSSCSKLDCRPVIVGVGPRGCNHRLLGTLAHEAGFTYLDSCLNGPARAAELWNAVEPALDFSVGVGHANSRPSRSLLV